MTGKTVARDRRTECVEFLEKLDAGMAQFHPGFLVACDGEQLHLRRVGDAVETRIVSGDELARVKQRIEDYRRLVALDQPARPTGNLVGPEVIEALENGVDRLIAEVCVQGPDLDAVETVLRDNGLRSAGLILKQIFERQDGRIEAPCCKDCGTTMKRHSKRPKTYTTRLADVTVERNYFYCRCCKTGVYPLDEWLHLTGKSVTPGFERIVMSVSGEMGSTKGTAKIKDLCGVWISRSRLARATGTLGEEVVRYEREDVVKAADGPALAVVAADGTGVPMHPKELQGRAGKQEDGGAKTREAKVLRICEVKPHPKTGKARAVANSITQSSVIDSAQVGPGGGTMSEFSARMGREADRRGSFLAPTVVVLSDGAKWIANSVNALFGNQNVILILDQYHALEKLGDALKEVFPVKRKRDPHYARLKDMIKAGQASEVVDELAKRWSQYPKVQECLTYFRSNLHRMRYHEYRSQGLPVGSGLIEAACKYIVGDRLKKTGSRWTVAGANGLMGIRCCEENNRVADFLQWRRDSHSSPWQLAAA